MKRTLADLFAVPPLSWGSRGDPYLWEDVRLHAINNNIPLPNSIECLVKQLHALFEGFTGHTVNERNWFFVEKYANGGMSSGHVEPSGWREGGKIFDYIQQSFIRAAMADELSGELK